MDSPVAVSCGRHDSCHRGGDRFFSQITLLLIASLYAATALSSNSRVPSDTYGFAPRLSHARRAG